MKTIKLSCLLAVLIFCVGMIQAEVIYGEHGKCVVQAKPLDTKETTQRVPFWSFRWAIFNFEDGKGAQFAASAGPPKYVRSDQFIKAELYDASKTYDLTKEHVLYTKVEGNADDSTLRVLENNGMFLRYNDVGGEGVLPLPVWTFHKLGSSTTEEKGAPGQRREKWSFKFFEEERIMDCVISPLPGLSDDKPKDYSGNRKPFSKEEKDCIRKFMKGIAGDTINVLACAVS